MKPTVISGGDNTNAPSNPAANNNNNNPNNNQQDDNTNQNIHGSQRQFPSHFQSGFGFGPSLVDDMFADDDFRPHTTTRMRDPWGFGARKRCGNMPNEDPYRRYLADDSDLFPGFQDPDWDSMRGRRRVAPQQQNSAPGSEPRSDFFDHIPAHFRSYIPDSFGFSNMRHQPNTAASAATDHSQSYPPRPQQQYCEPQAQRQTNHSTEAQPQYYQPQPQQQPQQQQQQPPRPKFCDASIQTEDDLNAGTPPSPTDQGQNLNQHGLRNTVDLGQKSPQEEPREPRAQSAPPVNDANHNYASASSSAYAFAGPGNGQTSATTYASTGTNPQTPTSGPQQPAFNRQRPQPNNPPQPPQRHHIPQYQAPPQYQQHQQASPQPSSHEEGSGFVRHVPIFIEGRSEPVNTPQQQQRKPPTPKAQPHQEHHRPTPLNTQQAQAHAQASAPTQSPEVPQTPHTTASINKIQSIQRDVLDLMTKVEQFKGAKKDKEYMYLDEMLTRNLLSLDTIDTNGKDSIRLARREAIKCIEASINVLEAKAEENARIAQQTMMDVENPAAAQVEAAVETEVPTEEAEAIASAEATSKAESSPVQNDKTNKKDDETVPKPNEYPKDITPESKAPEEPAVEAPSSAEREPQEPCNEITEKSSTEKPPKAPGSPKKKIVRKVKKIADKKDSQDDGKTEGETEPTKEDAASEASAAESSAADTHDGKSEEKQ